MYIQCTCNSHRSIICCKQGNCDHTFPLPHLPIYLPPRWLSPSTLPQMSPERHLILHVLQTVLTHPQSRHLTVLIGVGREVPGVDFVASDLNFVNVLDFGERFVFSRAAVVGSISA